MPTPFDFVPLMDSFLRAKRRANPSSKTPETYRTAIVEFGAWLGTLPDEALVFRAATARKRQVVALPAAIEETGELTVDHIRCHLDYLTRRGQLPGGRNASVKREGRILSSNTVSNRWRALSSFIGWLIEAEEFPAGYDPRIGVEVPKLVDNPKDVIGLSEMTALVNTCGKGRHRDRTFLDVRDEAILRVFFEAGARRSEVANAKLDWLNLEGNRLRVDGYYVKTNVGKDIPLSDKTTIALGKYLRKRATHKHADRPELWIAAKGAFTPGGVYQMIRRRGTMAGLKLHPHILRHSFANVFLDEGGTEEELKYLGGWSTDKQVRHYSRANGQRRAAKAHANLNIGDRI